MLRVIAETTERVDVFRTRRVRTCLSLSVNKIHPSLHEPTLSASFLPYELCYTGAETWERKPERRCHHVLTIGIAICGCHPVARGTPPRTSQSADGHEGRPGEEILCPRPEPAGGPRAVPELDGPGGSGRGKSNSPGPAHPHAGTEDGAAG